MTLLSHVTESQLFGRQTIEGLNANLHLVERRHEFQSEQLLHTLMSAAVEPELWSDVCAVLAKIARAGLCTLSSLEAPDRRMRYGNRQRSASFPCTRRIANYVKHQHVGFCLETPLDVADSAQESPGCGVALNFGMDGLWLLRLSRPLLADCFDTSTVHVLNRLLPLFEATALLSRQLISSALAGMHSAHTAMGQPHAILSAQGRLLSCNAAYKSIGPHYFAHANVKPLPLAHAEAVSFAAALSTLAHDPGTAELPLRDSTAPCIVALSLARDVPARISNDPLISLALHGLNETRSPKPHVLAHLFGLTTREADVASRLAAGTSVGDIARQHDVAIGTIRVQLKSIFRKLKVNSQIELVTKLQGL